jgi:catechol 2,3-dioxygenase
MRITRVSLRASDVERSAEFYSQFSGLEVRGSDDGTVDLGARNGGPVRLELLPARDGGPAPQRAAGLFHTAFRYPGRAGLGAALRRLAEGGWPLSGASDHLVSEALYLDDPDGLGIELYRDRPRAEWPEPEPGQGVAMATLPLDLDPIVAAAAPDGGADGIDVGHVHLKVAAIEPAVEFWTSGIGMEVRARYGADAAFIASGGYHHHIGVNTWFSRGAALEPADGPGIEQVVVGVGEAGELEGIADRLGDLGAGTDERAGGIETRTPDGVSVRVEVEDQ